MAQDSDMGVPPFAGLSAKGVEALVALTQDSSRPRLASAHGESDGFRRFFKEYLRSRNGRKGDSISRFELDETSERIDLYMYNARTGELETKRSPEELVDALMGLESLHDAPLRSFYVDITI